MSFHSSEGAANHNHNHNHDGNNDASPSPSSPGEIALEIHDRIPFGPNDKILCQYAGVQVWDNCYVVRTETGTAVRPPTVHAHTPYELDCQARSIAAVRKGAKGKSELVLLEGL